MTDTDDLYKQLLQLSKDINDVGSSLSGEIRNSERGLGGQIEKVGERVGSVEVEVATLKTETKNQGREIRDLKNEVKRKKTPSRTFPAATTEVPVRSSYLPKALATKDFKFWAAVGSMITGGILTLLNLLGILSF